MKSHKVQVSLTKILQNGLMFNTYFNDLAFELDKPKSTTLKLPNGAHISGLMYAIDVIVVATIPLALENWFGHC